jgi:7-cyano-7-deazaguanine synthase in queuosine biosynthesis
MKIYCTPKGNVNIVDSELKVILFDRSQNKNEGYIGIDIKKKIIKEKLNPVPKAWDIVSIALSAIAADYAGHRKKSHDGWTRDFDMTIAVNEPDFWNQQSALLSKQLGFLTSDRWKFTFIDGGFLPSPPPKNKEVLLKNDSVTLLSGGLDSFIGLIDIIHAGKNPIAVSQLVIGDAEKQRKITKLFDNNVSHFQFNHNVSVPNPETPSSQRARSIIFLAYGILIATCLEKYKHGAEATLYMCENGYISLNPPLTGIRIGSLSTRTTNPVFLLQIQTLLNNAGINVKIQNPYQYSTKGKMLRECKNQDLLKSFAHKTTSCGKYKIHGHNHCGRCVPCLIRRAAFKEWGIPDQTFYKFSNLSLNSENYARYDDVRSACMAVLEARHTGLKRWIGASLNHSLLGDTSAYEKTIEEGLKELENLLKGFNLV